MDGINCNHYVADLMWKRRFKKAWSVYRHVSAIRGLLQWTGWWKYIVLFLNTLVAYMAAYWVSITSSLSPAIVVLFGLGCFALVLLIAGFGAALYRVIAAENVTLPSKGPQRSAEQESSARWPDFELLRSNEPDGLAIRIRNNTQTTCPECNAHLSYLGLISENNGRVERNAGMFTGKVLLKTQAISPGQESDKGYIAKMPSAKYSFFTVADAETGEPQSFRQPGTYVADINITVRSPDGQKHIPAQQFFKWNRGEAPQFVDFPVLR